MSDERDRSQDFHDPDFEHRMPRPDAIPRQTTLARVEREMWKRLDELRAIASQWMRPWGGR
jgi:hypothetical protein